MCVADAPSSGETHASPPTGGARPDQRIGRARRVTQSRVFQEAFAQGRRSVGTLMVMWLRRGEGAGLRLGVVASRRSFRRAVDRVRVKRLLREAYRLNRFRLRGDCDVILVARQRLLGVGLQAAQTELMYLAKKAGLLARERA